MVCSMTGYGRGSACADGREIVIEVKSVNHRYKDINIRLPRHINFAEDIIREGVGLAIARGHIDVYVNYRNNRSDARLVLVDEELLNQYYMAGGNAAKKLKIPNDLTLISLLQLPDATRVQETEEDKQAVVSIINQALDIALTALKQMRSKEGIRLEADLKEHLNEVVKLVKSIEARSHLVVEDYRTKLNQRISDLLTEVDIDKARLATEVALFADRAAIDEEIVRLKSHIELFMDTLLSNEPAGRRLDFIVQEMNREFNTIGSKANDIELTNAVLAGKGEIEKLKEQIQNIE